MKLKRILLIVLCLALTFSFTACAKPQENVEESNTTPDSKFGGTLNVGIISDPDTLNPMVSNDRIGSWILNNIYPTILLMNEDAVKIPYIAEDITTSEDGKTVTLKLKEGLKWQDGTPFTSEDIKFTGELTYEKKLSPQASVFDELESVETPDPLTIVYNLKRPFPVFMGKLGFWIRIVPKHIWEKIEDPKTFANEENPVGLGPFKLTEAKRGQYYVIERVDQWFGSPEGKPYLDKIIFRIYPDVNTMVLALKKGEIDLTVKDIPHSAAEELKSDPNFTVVQNASLGYSYVGFNMKNEFLKDFKVREAIATAIDRDKIIEIALEGDGMKIDTPVAPVYPEILNQDAKLPEYSPENARKILNDAGYKDADANGFLKGPNGKHISLEMIYDGNDMYLKKTAQILVSNMKDAGIELKLKALEKATYSDLLFNQMSFDVNLGGWGIIDPLNDSLYSCYHSKAKMNFMGRQAGIIDDLIENVRYSKSKEEEVENLYKFQEEFLKEMSVVPLYVQKYNFAYSNKFDGFKIFPSDLKGLIDPQSTAGVYLKK